MKKQLITLVFLGFSFVSFSQVRKPTTNDNIYNYLSEILNVKVSFYLLNGYKTEIKDSLRYELSMIGVLDTLSNKYSYYCNESLDSLFKKNNLTFPLTIPLKNVATQETNLVVLSVRTHSRRNCSID
jgi:hypothetical protein